MKQENLDELRNIYLGLVTGGEGPEVLSEAPTSGVYEAKKKLDQVGQEEDDIDNDGDTDKSDKYLLNRRKVRSKAIGEATSMSKRGLDEPSIRNKIASKTRGGSFADKATALADKETYGDKKKERG